VSGDASESLAASVQGMSVTPCSADDPAMTDHMRRRLAENRSLISELAAGLVGAASSVHGFSGAVSGASPFASPFASPVAAVDRHVAPLTLS
jgi:hypothetical protein